MKSLDIFLIPEIHKIINDYKKEIDIIYNLQNDLISQKIKFKVFNNTFNIIYVNVNTDYFCIKINNSIFKDIKGFNLYFYSLSENKKTLLYYIFLEQILDKFKSLDLNIFYNSFKYIIFNFFFNDCRNLLKTKTYTIKKVLPYDFDFFYNKYGISNNLKKIKRLDYNIKIFLRNNNQKILNII